jgi:uncharacterized protein (TIGR02757 family)
MSGFAVSLRTKRILDAAATRFEDPAFITSDPISVPHRFTLKQDMEIMGFWTAMLAWGQRPVIIQNALRLADLMDQAPYQFITEHTERDRERFVTFKHRTFQTTDTLYFLEFLQQYYQQHQSLEDAFARHITPVDAHVGPALAGFHDLFFDHPWAPDRTRKHIATPTRGSTCKRINMFLRWMVRPSDRGVDFGIWQQIKPAQLLVPLDVHVDRIARSLQLIDRKQTDWLTVLELTERLRTIAPEDPVRYDFALFGMGIEGKGGNI